MRLLLPALIFALSACSGKDEAPSTYASVRVGEGRIAAKAASPDSFGSLVFRRDTDTGGKRRTRYFVLNGKRVAIPAIGSEVAVRVPPGLHFVGVHCNLRAREPKISETSITVEAGSTYVFQDQTYLASEDCRIAPASSYRS